MKASRGMGDINPSKMPKGKKIIRKDNPNVVEEYAKGGSTNWISGAIKKPGALHKSLGVPLSKPIPSAKLAKATLKPGKMGKRARLAQTLKGFK
jgi:hypothetical protein